MRARAAMVCLLAATEAAAQGVRIRVLDEQANAPIPGALVALKRGGRTMSERLTNADGSRLLRAPPDTGYVVEIRRVGYEPFVSARFAMPASDTQSLVLRVPAVRAVLPTPVVPAPKRAPCRAGDAGRERAGELWQQMRTALSSAEIVRTEALEPLAISRYERALSRSGAVLSESPALGAGLGTRPFRTAPAAELSRSGFQVTDSAGQAAFRAPDAEVLLSDEFAADHCFEVVSGAGATAGMIGLRFAPATRRGITDVQGVVWADSETAQLRLAEFSYVFGAAVDAGDAGGRIRFEQLGSANWIAREWTLRTPVLAPRGQVMGYREEGGEALSVTPRMRFVMDSMANARKVPGVITGVVTDSLTGKWFAGARVWVDSAGAQSRTDAKGVYFLRGVPPGPHLVRFSHPMLDSIGVRMPGVLANVKSESMVDANLGGPSLRTLIGGSCSDTLAVMTGTVRDAVSGAPVDSASVTLTWIDLQLGPDRRPKLILPRETTAGTDASGRYGACVPAGVEVSLTAQRGVARTAQVDALTETRRLGIQDFKLDVSAPDSLRGAAEVRGVVKYQDGTPLGSAVVTLTEPEVSVATDTAGRFRIAGIPGGTRSLDARALGHAPQRVFVDAIPGAVTEVPIYLRKVTLLDPIIVRAAADGRSAATLAGLAERQRRHQGMRLTAGQLRGYGNARLDAVIRSLPYARLRGTARLGSTPVQTLMLQNERGQECEPTVWLDGRRSDVSFILQVRVSDVLSFEVMRMRGEVPVEYQDFADCGALLVWLKPRR